jgi:pyridoxine 4-dehydrogenase
MATAPADGVDLEFHIGGDLRVQRIGFGAMRIVGPGAWGPPQDRGECLATLRRLVDLDVNLIDTAESYGPQISESLIAEALYPYPSHLVIATKGGFNRSGPGRWQIDCRPERLREALDGSLRRLRVERIDLYQLHRIDPAVPEHDQFGFLQQAQREGKIRQVGLSEAGIEQIQRAQQFFTVASVQNQYSLADRRWDAVVDFCDRHAIAFMAWAPLDGARPSRTLVGHYVRVARNLLKRESALARIARHHGATSAQIALAWLLRRAKVVIPIPGTSTRTHLEENAAAARLTLSDEEFASLST